MKEKEKAAQMNSKTNKLLTKVQKTKEPQMRKIHHLARKRLKCLHPSQERKRWRGDNHQNPRKRGSLQDRRSLEHRALWLSPRLIRKRKRRMS